MGWQLLRKALSWSRSRVSLPVGEEPGKGKPLNVLNKYLPSVCWPWDLHKQGLHSNAGVQHKDMTPADAVKSCDKGHLTSFLRGWRCPGGGDICLE